MVPLSLWFTICEILLSGHIGRNVGNQNSSGASKPSLVSSY